MGKRFAYVTSDEPENKKELEKHHDAFEVGDNDFLATEAERPSHLWILPAEGGKAKRLTSGVEPSQERTAQFPSVSHLVGLPMESGSCLRGRSILIKATATSRLCKCSTWKRRDSQTHKARKI